MAILNNLSKDYFAKMRSDANRLKKLGGYSFAAYHQQMDVIDTLEDFFLKQEYGFVEPGSCVSSEEHNRIVRELSWEITNKNKEIADLKIYKDYSALCKSELDITKKSLNDIKSIIGEKDV